MLVASDELTDKDYPAISKVKGDIFMIVGATLYGFSTFKFVPLLTISFEPSQSFAGTFFTVFSCSKCDGRVLRQKITTL